MIVTAARAFVVTEANRISMEDNSLKRNFNLKTILLHFLAKYLLHRIRPITNQKNKKSNLERNITYQEREKI